MPLFSVLLCLISSAYAADPILEALIDEALRNNAEVAAASKGYQAATRRGRQASALPETMFSAGYASSGRPWPGAGLGVDPTSNIGFMVTQEFPFPGKRELRGKIADTEAQAEYQDYRAAQLAVVSRLKQAYYRLGYTYAAMEVLNKNKDLLTRFLRITEVRYSVGRASQQDVFKAQTQLAILETRLVQLNRDQQARQAEILSLLNRPPASAPVGRVALVKPPKLTRTLEDLYAMANGRAPMIQREQRIVLRNQLATNLARKDFYPDYSVSGGYFNMGGMPDMYQLRVDFKLPTSFFRKQRAAVEEQAALVSQARKALEATAQSLAFRLKDDFLMYETSRRLMDLYEKTVVPQSSLALESSLASYSNGSVDFLSVLTNYLTMVDFEMNYNEELLNVNLALARLEEMAGTMSFEQEASK
ncbi:MAG: TolC family protein [Bryobacterales bacterium]|nr:TolC family protein [Bryobacterales bacterium]